MLIFKSRLCSLTRFQRKIIFKRLRIDFGFCLSNLLPTVVLITLLPRVDHPLSRGVILSFSSKVCLRLGAMPRPPILIFSDFLSKEYVNVYVKCIWVLQFIQYCRLKCSNCAVTHLKGIGGRSPPIKFCDI